MLSRAAVVGRAFSRESLGALTPDREARELDGRLASLERRRLVRPRGDDHEFVHPLVRGAAYDAIGRPERAAMHETFARWLDRRGESDELVGTHLERAALDQLPWSRTRGSSRARRRSSRGSRGAGLCSIRPSRRREPPRASCGVPRPGSPERLELECSLGHALKGIGEASSRRRAPRERRGALASRTTGTGPSSERESSSSTRGSGQAS